MKFAFAIIAVALAASNPPFHDPHTGDVNEHDGKPIGRGWQNYKHAAPKRKDPTPENPWNSKPAGRGNLDKIDEQDRRPAQPTSRPTSFPTKSGAGCRYGRRTVHVGWKGPGLNSNYCNLWECTKTGWNKAQRQCQIQGDICSHTTCDFVKDFKSKRKCRQGEKGCFVMVQSHHSEEVGGRHRCGYSKPLTNAGAFAPASAGKTLAASLANSTGSTPRPAPMASPASTTTLTTTRTTRRTRVAAPATST